jgi:hypothetical protein
VLELPNPPLQPTAEKARRLGARVVSQTRHMDLLFVFCCVLFLGQLGASHTRSGVRTGHGHIALLSLLC